jgi:hypothetical protein
LGGLEDQTKGDALPWSHRDLSFCRIITRRLAADMNFSRVCGQRQAQGLLWDIAVSDAKAEARRGPWHDHDQPADPVTKGFPLGTSRLFRCMIARLAASELLGLSCRQVELGDRFGEPIELSERPGDVEPRVRRRAELKHLAEGANRRLEVPFVIMAKPFLEAQLEHRVSRLRPSWPKTRDAARDQQRCDHDPAHLAKRVSLPFWAVDTTDIYQRRCRPTKVRLALWPPAR